MGTTPGIPKAGFGLGNGLTQGHEIPRSDGDDALFVAITQGQFPLFVTELQRHE